MAEMNKRDEVHVILARSYATMFGFFVAGVGLDAHYRLALLENAPAVLLGWLLIILASVLILWAQRTSRHYKKDSVTKETFMQGPYRYSRSPTHWGLLFLIIGFGLIINATFVVLLAILSFLLARFYFLPKEEALLEQKYGAPYEEYRKTVRL